ncbi:uncharacterized protein LOC120344015 [Styela clava]
MSYKDEGIITVQKCTNDDEWEKLRYCFEKSFENYPLHTYYMPEISKRADFLKRYLNACHSATKKKEGIVMAIRKNTEIIGGFIFDPIPSSKSSFVLDSERFTEAYLENNIDHHYPESFSRIKRYERWEDQTILELFRKHSLKLQWEGMFCAIDPSYRGGGIGSILTNTNPFANENISVTSGTNCISETSNAAELLLKADGQIIDINGIREEKDPRRKLVPILIICHDRQSVGFMIKNRCQLIAEKTYKDDIETSVLQFPVYFFKGEIIVENYKL